MTSHGTAPRSHSEFGYFVLGTMCSWFHVVNVTSSRLRGKHTLETYDEHERTCFQDLSHLSLERAGLVPLREQLVWSTLVPTSASIALERLLSLYILKFSGTIVTQKGHRKLLERQRHHHRALAKPVFDCAR